MTFQIISTRPNGVASIVAVRHAESKKEALDAWLEKNTPMAGNEYKAVAA